MGTLIQDLRYAIRTMAKKPGFALIAILTLALGIGANAAIFSVVNTVLLQPLPYVHPDRIVVLGSHWQKTGNIGWVSQPDFQDWHDQSSTFDSMAYYTSEEVAAAGGSQAEYVTAAAVSPEFFRVFQVQPQLGRMFSKEEQVPGGPQAAIISDALWQRNYEHSPAVLGQILRTQNRSFTIVGVAPTGFRFPAANEIWLSMAAFLSPGEVEDRSAHNYEAVARLKDGVSLQAAQADMLTVSSRLAQQYPLSDKDMYAAVVPMQDLMVSDVRTTLYLLLGAVALVLLISCANVANLLLARATGRAREIAVRAAMGASRGRLIRQLMIESSVLSVVSGFLGILLAIWGTSALVALAPVGIPRLNEIHVDNRVLAFTFLVSVLSCLFFGLAPALHSSRVNLSEALKQGGARTGATAGSGRLRNSLVVAEIALAVVLVAAAGLLMKSLLAISGVNLGFHPDHILVMRTSVPESDWDSARRATNFYTQLLQQVRALPGVTSAAAANGTPAGGFMSNGGYWLEGGPGPEEMGMSAPQAGFPVVSPGYFRTLEIPIVRGRDFTDADNYGAPMVAIISESLARQSFQNTDPIGKRIMCGLDPQSQKLMTIVGVAGDIRIHSPTIPPGPQLYLPYMQHPYKGSYMSVLVKARIELQTLDPTLQGMVRALNPDVPARFTTLETMLSDSVSSSKFLAMLIGFFAALALSMAMAGIYGVMVYAVSQRLSEIGVRMALGAQASDVLRLVLGQGLGLALIGLAIGIAGAFSFSRLLSGFLFGTQPYDPATFAGVCAVVIAAALAACFIPARRAMRVDPIVALRYE